MIYSRPTLSSKCVARSGTPRCACRISKRRKRFHAEISRFFVLGAICAIAFPIYSACAQTNSFKQTNLVSDSPGIAANTDPNLNNPWAVAFVPGQPFRIANNKGGNSMVYDPNGVPMGSLGVPAPTGSSNPSTPTGIVANLINGIVFGFNVNRVASRFIFVTEDGTVSGWNGTGTDAFLVVDNSTMGAVYKGLALVENDSGNFILAANFNSDDVEAYDAGFTPRHSLERPSWTQHFLPDLPRLEFLRESNRFRGIARRSRRP